MQHWQEAVLTANNRDSMRQLAHNLFQFSYLQFNIIKRQLQIIVEFLVSDQVIWLLQSLGLPQNQDSLLLLIYQDGIRLQRCLFLFRYHVKLIILVGILLPETLVCKHTLLPLLG